MGKSGAGLQGLIWCLVFVFLDASQAVYFGGILQHLDGFLIGGMMYKLQHQEEYDAKNGGNKNNSSNNISNDKKEGFINSTFSNDPTNNQLEHSKYSKRMEGDKKRLIQNSNSSLPCLRFLKL